MTFSRSKIGWHVHLALLGLSAISDTPDAGNLSDKTRVLGKRPPPNPVRVLQRLIQICIGETPTL